MLTLYIHILIRKNGEEVYGLSFNQWSDLRSGGGGGEPVRAPLQYHTSYICTENMLILRVFVTMHGSNSGEHSSAAPPHICSLQVDFFRFPQVRRGSLLAIALYGHVCITVSSAWSICLSSLKLQLITPTAPSELSVCRDNSVSSFGLENVAKLVRIMQANENLGALATQVRPGEE